MQVQGEEWNSQPLATQPLAVVANEPAAQLPPGPVQKPEPSGLSVWLVLLLVVLAVGRGRLLD